MTTCTYDDISIGLRDNSWQKLSCQDVQAFLSYLSIPDIVGKAAPLLRPVTPATMPRSNAARPVVSRPASVPMPVGMPAAAPAAMRTLEPTMPAAGAPAMTTTPLSPLQETVYSDFSALSPESEETWKPLESSFAYLMLASKGRGGARPTR